MPEKWDVKEEYRNLFIEESQDQIQEWEESLLVLEKNTEDREQIDRLFRAIHTLKGSAGFVGFDELQRLNHDLESALQSIRDGEAKLTPEIIEILFEGLDVSKRCIDAVAANDLNGIETDGFMEKLSRLHLGEPGSTDAESFEPTDTAEPPESQPAPPGRVSPSTDGTKKRFLIPVTIQKGGSEGYLKGLLIQHKLEEVGSIILVSPTLEELKLSKQDFSFSITVETGEDPSEFIKTISLDLVEIGEVVDLSNQPEKNREEMGERGRPEKNRQPGPRPGKTEEVVRVPVEKLDIMLNLVGELVVQNSGFISTTDLMRQAYGRNDLILDLEEKTESLAKIARDLQDAVMKVRMLPVAAVFNRFVRVVRDLSKARGKDVELTIFGEETEIDKKVMDRISEPLVHLIRNSVDHGIEEREGRLAAGKSSTGHIRLGAYQEGDHICIEVTDDGRGLEREKIIDKAVERALINRKEASSISDEQVFGLIFRAGFSTAEEITEVSGRGVGLDVVKSTVDEMGGDIHIRSRAGFGTTIVITLPLTMAIIPAILVTVKESLFAIPLSSVREVVKVTNGELKTVQGSKVINLRNEVVSVADLREVLNIGGNGRSSQEVRNSIVIVDYSGNKIGIAVEKLLGNEEIVIKSLSRHYREIEGIVGASILGNGKIALIIDVETMIRKHCRDVRLAGEEKSDVSFRLANVLYEEGGADETAVEETAVVNDVGGSGTNPAAEEVMESTTAPSNCATDETERGDEAVNGSLLFNLDAHQRETLEDIHATGAVTASMSMSTFIGQDIRVSFPETKIIPLGDVAGELGGEEMPVGGIFVPLLGDITGGMMMVLPRELLLQFSDMILRREPGATREVGEEEMSALKEMGNILSASFINSMGDETGLLINLSVPQMTIDMCLSVIDTVIAGFNQPGDKIILTQAELYISDQEKALCHMLLFLDMDSMERIENSLTGDSGSLTGNQKGVASERAYEGIGG